MLLASNPISNVQWEIAVCATVGDAMENTTAKTKVTKQIVVK